MHPTNRQHVFPLAPEGPSTHDPIEKIIEGLDLGGFGADGPADLRIGDVAQQKERPLDPAEFAKSEAQPAFPVVRAEFVSAAAWTAAPARLGSRGQPASCPANASRSAASRSLW